MARVRPWSSSVREEATHATLEIRDQGIGIREEDRHRIFERFERAVPHENYSGFGLGLWIVQEIVSALGGSVIDVDTGSAAFRGNGLRSSLRYVAEWDLGDWSLGLMPGLVRDRGDDGRHFVSGLFALTGTTPIAPRWRAFVELAVPRIVGKVHGGTQASVDTGLTWTVSDDIQLDVSLQRGLTRETPDLTAGVGLSIRF